MTPARRRAAPPTAESSPPITPQPTLKPWHSPESRTPAVRTRSVPNPPAHPSLLQLRRQPPRPCPLSFATATRPCPSSPRALGAALHENLTLHSALCRREAGAFQKAIQSGDDVVVACTQETRLFAELAQQTEGADLGHQVRQHPRNRRLEQGRSPGQPENRRPAGAGASARRRTRADRDLQERRPPADHRRAGCGRARCRAGVGCAGCHRCSAWARARAAALQERRYPVLAGQIKQLTGWLGAFELKWTRSNPIDLDLCTRCNACLSACPEGAIGLDYQIDSALVQVPPRLRQGLRHAPGRLTSAASPKALSEKFDLVLDLRATPAFTQHALPQGYFRWDGQDSRTLLQLRALVGEFEKPKFFDYKQKLCAHSRNEKTGCSACIDVCSASAISSEQEPPADQGQSRTCAWAAAPAPRSARPAPSRYAYPRAGRAGRQDQDPAGHLCQGRRQACRAAAAQPGSRHAPAGRPGPHGPAGRGDPRRAGAGAAAGAVAHRLSRAGPVALRPLPMALRRSGC